MKKYYLTFSHKIDSYYDAYAISLELVEKVILLNLSNISFFSDKKTSYGFFDFGLFNFHRKIIPIFKLKKIKIENKKNLYTFIMNKESFKFGFVIGTKNINIILGEEKKIEKQDLLKKSLFKNEKDISIVTHSKRKIFLVENFNFLKEEIEKTED